ncbi:TPA: hypothetical protein WIU75_001508 [Neisseria meningitidis]
MINIIATWAMALTYIFLLLFIIVFIPIQLYLENIKKKKFKSRIIDILKNNHNNLDLNDIKQMTEAVNLNNFAARKIIKQLYYTDELNLNLVRQLQKEIQQEEPFDGCSDELKPTLIGINELSETHGSESQKHLLTPIISELKELNQIKHDHKKMKTQSYIAYIIAIISFFIGSISFYYTITAPSGKEIANTVVEQLKANQNQQ